MLRLSGVFTANHMYEPFENGFFFLDIFHYYLVNCTQRDSIYCIQLLKYHPLYKLFLELLPTVLSIIRNILMSSSAAANGFVTIANRIPPVESGWICDPSPAGQLPQADWPPRQTTITKPLSPHTLHGRRTPSWSAAFKAWKWTPSSARLLVASGPPLFGTNNRPIYPCVFALPEARVKMCNLLCFFFTPRIATHLVSRAARCCDTRSLGRLCAAIPLDHRV